MRYAFHYPYEKMDMIRHNLILSDDNQWLVGMDVEYLFKDYMAEVGIINERIVLISGRLVGINPKFSERWARGMFP